MWSCWKVAWITTQKKLGTRPSPHFSQNGLIALKIPWTLSPLDMSTRTEFGPDRLRFAGLILERLIFRPKKSLQYRLSAYKIHTQLQWNTNRDLHMPSSRVSLRMTLSNFEWLSEISNDIKYRAAYLRQLSFLFHRFFLRDAMQAMPSCGVCASVCLSRSYILSKRIKISSKCFHHQ